MKKELEIKVLGEAVEEIEEFIEIFDQEDGDLHEARMCLELSLQDLTDEKYKGLQKRYYEADDLLDKAEAKFRRLYTDLSHSLMRMKLFDDEFTEEVAKQHASELYGWLQSACGDIAYSTVDQYKKGVSMAPEGVDLKLDQAKKDGVTDLQGWYADEIFNSEDDIGDFIGDRIHDAAKGDDKRMVGIATMLKEFNNTALNKAMDTFIARHSEG